MPKGGPQPGSGCPKGTKHKKTLEEEALRAAIFAYAKENMDKLLGNLNLLSVKDSNAAKIIIEQAVGRPRQRMEVTGENGGPLNITWGGNDTDSNPV